jgi:hypothetical protein
MQEYRCTYRGAIPRAGLESRPAVWRGRIDLRLCLIALPEGQWRHRHRWLHCSRIARSPVRLMPARHAAPTRAPHSLAAQRAAAVEGRRRRTASLNTREPQHRT